MGGVIGVAPDYSRLPGGIDVVGVGAPASTWSASARRHHRGRRALHPCDTASVSHGAVGFSLTAAARLASRSGYGVVVRPAVFGLLRGSPLQ